MLSGKNIVIGVCGGIAAYKAVETVSRLKKLGANINVIMTKNSLEFVTPLTFQSLSKNPVTTDMFESPKNWDVEHISLARKADIFVVVPSTANIIGKIANGIADDMLSTTIMATNAPVVFVPAMNHVMYKNRIVQRNISLLKEYGYIIMEPETGLMAAEGEYGKGRLPEPEKIVEFIEQLLSVKKDLENKRILITAGPTIEAIDPVRFISNHSSGKMGYSLAKAANSRGAKVTLITGPVNIEKPAGVEVVRVNSAEEMHLAAIKSYESCDAVILAAAVADYRCKQVKSEKIKKSEEGLILELVKNPDIAHELGRIKKHKIHIGFCAETNDLINNALSKLKTKNFDMIVANDVTLEGAGFGTETNIVKILKRDGTTLDLPIMSKLDVANCILDELEKEFK